MKFGHGQQYQLSFFQCGQQKLQSLPLFLHLRYIVKTIIPAPTAPTIHGGGVLFCGFSEVDSANLAGVISAINVVNVVSAVNATSVLRVRTACGAVHALKYLINKWYTHSRVSGLKCGALFECGTGEHHVNRYFLFKRKKLYFWVL